MQTDQAPEAIEIRHGGDPLAAMYIVAAAALGLAGLAIVVLMFIPTDWFDGRDDSDAWVPGSLPAWTPIDVAADFTEPVGVREVGPGQYRVVIEAVNWAFRPNEIRVPVGAEVTFRARAAEDYHGIALIGTPVLFSLEQNQSKEATHTFTEPGEYLFVCSEYCGAGHISMAGKVIVE